MNPNSQFSGQQPGGLNSTQNQSSLLFGQPNLFGNQSSTQSSPLFGQSTPAFVTSTPHSSLFGQTSTVQSNASHNVAPFGQVANRQSAALFGQATSNQSATLFRQTMASQSGSPFGQTTVSQSTSSLGQVTNNQPVSLFGQTATSQSGSFFGQSATTQAVSPFRQATVVTSQSATTLAGSPFGQAAATTQAGSPFGQAAGSPFGQAAATTQAGSPFGQAAATTQAGSPFGQAAATTQAGSPFGQTAATTQAGSPFGQAAATTQAGSPFGQATSHFGQASAQHGTIQAASPFGKAAATQAASVFGQAAANQTKTLPPASAFGQTPTSKTVTFATQTGSFFGKRASVLGQATTELSTKFSSDGQDFEKLSSAQTPQFGQAAAGHGYGFAQGTSSNLSQPSASQSSAFIPTNPGQSTTSWYGKSSGIPRKALFGEKNVFGQEISHSGLFAVEIQKEMKAAESGDGQTASAPTLGSENLFKPPANSTFKPIFGTMTEKPPSHGFTSFGVSSSVKSKSGSNLDEGSSDESKSGRNVPFSVSEEKTKDEIGTAQSTFKSYVGAKLSDTPSHLLENVRKEEFLQRKGGQDRSSIKHGSALTDEASSRLGDHPPLKRNKRLEHQIPGGANLFRRIFREAVKSNKKTDRVNPKIEVGASQHSVSDTNISSTSQPLPSKNYLSSAIAQQNPAKVQPSAGTSQTGSGKNEPSVRQSQSILGRNISKPASSYQGTIRSVSAGPSQPVLAKPRPLLEIEVTPPSSSLLPGSKKTPIRRARRSDSTDSVSPLSPNDLTVIQIRNVPKRLNHKQYLQKYFSKFGKVQRIDCKPGSKLVNVHFFNHTSAAHAKKMGTKLHKDVSIFWFRKKTSKSSCGLAWIQFDVFPMLSFCRSPNKKSLVSKTINFDTEICDSQAPSSETTAISLLPTLSHLLGTVAETSEEKYRLLDQRDKILRQTRVKRTELDQAKVFVGTCPDMCPEKERYMREIRNQLSIYEFFPGTDKLDHAAAVKEYSRSSADQEEPLPHELRPTHVLKMTMDYLVTQIMDQGDGNYREWYDFVWNRTRGIRKDITQQHLCDLITVSLIEKCTRFHIHCAYQLCEEPTSSFDPKINNENLTKCLQSLKEMYQDLQNRGVSCPCEPEFRCYSVLLNLNTGNILREVQHFHPHIRNSTEVKFAVQVFEALNSTNFVRFFKLVRSGSYLNSCILNGYFSQIRLEGLRVINVAYTPSIQRTTSFPLENIMQMLFFHDASEAVQFLISYGLSVFEGYVELNRSAFSEPASLPSPKKCSFISNKCQVSVGEMVNGAPLPSFTLHHPVCSFDAQDKYTGGISIAEHGTRARQETSAEFKMESRVSETEEVTIKRTVVFQTVPEESTSAAAQTVFKPIFPPEKPSSPPRYSDQVGVSECVLACETQQGQVKLFFIQYLWESSKLSDELLREAITDYTRRVAQEEVQAEIARVQEEKRRLEEEARLMQEREKLLTVISKSQSRDLLENVLREEIYILANGELRQAVKLDHSARILRCSQDVCAKYVGQFIEEELFQLTRESQHEMHCYKKYIQRWREVVAARKKLRRQMRGFPAAPGSVAPEDKLKALIPSAAFTDNRLQQLREQSFHKMKVQHFFKELLRDAAWTPLDLPPLIVQHIPPWKKFIFWKVILILPEHMGPNDPNCILSDWLKAKFCRADGQSTQDMEEPVHTLALYSCLEKCGDSSVHVNVCVKVASGPIERSVIEQKKTQEAFLGTSGLLFLLPIQPDNDEDDIYWISARLQLKQILQAKPFFPPLSLAVLVPGQCQTMTEVSSAVKFLLSHCPRSLELRSLSLRQYIEDGVCNIFSKHFYHDTWERRKVHLPPQDPGAIIDFYNCSLTFLAKAISSEYLSDLSWPLSEFASPTGSFLMPHVGWNNPENLAWLKKVVISFQIPQMDIPPPGAPWIPVCSMIMEYIRQICRCPTSLPVLISEVQQLLRQTHRSWKARNEDVDETAPTVQDIPWNDLISICINHKLRDWDIPVRSTMTGEVEEMLVYFLEEDLNNFTPPKTWEKAQQSTLEETVLAADCFAVFVCFRFEEKLQYLMEERPLEELPSLYLPMYLPEVLLSQTEILPDLVDVTVCKPPGHSPVDHTGSIPSLRASMKGIAVPSKYMSGSETEAAVDRTRLRLSLEDSLDRLHRELRASQQEDRCFNLHLQTLLDMGDP
uniref:Germinal-center associated nuclear protein n=1 Tax=Leptobrachium leishanense TaxID=445787 RepID=A0A8C5WF42_9ANUR